MRRRFQIFFFCLPHAACLAIDVRFTLMLHAATLPFDAAADYAHDYAMLMIRYVSCAMLTPLPFCRYAARLRHDMRCLYKARSIYARDADAFMPFDAFATRRCCCAAGATLPALARLLYVC